MHVCPACGRRHEVTRARAEMAWGTQLCCSPECAEDARLREGARRLKSAQIRTEAAAYAAVGLLLLIVLAVKWA
jgi:hypothetical protein